MANEVTKIDPKGGEVQPAGPVTPMQMLQIAVERGADMDQLTKLMDLQERWEANEARKAFTEALNAFKANPPKLTKSKHVRFQTSKGVTEYDHATLDQVSEAVGKALSQHGLSHSWRVAQTDNQAISVTCVLRHRLGHSEDVTMRAMPDESGGKNGIQAIGSTTSYLQRYTLLAATGLAAADMDDDGAGSDLAPISAEQKERLIAAMKETDADTAKFLQYLGVENLDVLPADRFNQAMQALEKKRSAK